MAAPNAERGVVVWELKAGPETMSLPRPEKLWCVALAPKAARVAVRQPKGLALMSLPEGKVERTLPVAADFPSVAFSPDGELFAYGADDKKVSLIEVATGKERGPIAIEGAFAGVRWLHFSPDGKRLFLCTGSKVEGWDITGPPKALASFDSVDVWYKKVALSPDAKLFAAGIDAGNLRLADLATGKPVWTVPAHEDDITSLAISADGKQILTVCSSEADRAVRLWSAADGKQLAVFRYGGPLNQTDAALFAAGGKSVVTITKSGEMRCFNSATGRLVGRLPSGRWPFGKPVVSPDGQAVLFTSEKEIHLVQTASLRPETFADDLDVVRQDPPAEPPPTFAPERLTLALRPNSRVAFVAFPADGKRLVCATEKSEYLVWDLPGGKLSRSFRVFVREPQCRALSADGKVMAVGCHDSTVRLIDLESGTEAKVLRGHKSFVSCVAFSPDGKSLASGTGGFGEAEVFLWDIAGDKPAKGLLSGERRIGSLAFTADGKQLVVGVKGLRRFALPAGTELPALPHPEEINAVVASPDGQFVAAGGGFTTLALNDVSVWDSTGKPLHTLTGHVGNVTKLAFGPDGLLAVENNRDLAFWDARTGKKLATLYARLLALSPDGKSFVVWDSPNQLRLRDISSLRDGRLQSALAPALTLRAEASLRGDAVRVEMKSLGPDAIAALSSLAALPGPLELRLNETSRISDEAVAAVCAIQGLRRLEFGAIGATGLRDEHVKRIAALPGLEALDLSDCGKLTAKGLADLAGAARLRELDISNSSFGPEALGTLTPLKGLRTLRLRSVDDDGVNTLVGFPELTDLGMFGWEINHVGLARLGGSKRLKRLSIESLRVDAKAAAALGTLSGLEELRLVGAKIKDGAFAPLGRLTGLRRLDLAHSDITDESLKHLAGMTKLTSLRLDSTEKLTGTGLAYLSKATGLTSLKLDRTGVTDAGLAGLKGWSHLRELTLPDGITDAGLLHLTDLTSLESINLAQLRNVKGPGLAGLRNAKGLTELDLSQRPMTDADLEGLKDWKHLRILRLPKTITDAGLARLAGLVELRVLDVEDASGVTDAGLTHLQGMRKLEVLDLGGTKVTDKGLPAVEAMKSLSWLRLKGGVSEAAREKFKKSRPDVEVIAY